MSNSTADGTSGDADRPNRYLLVVDSNIRDLFTATMLLQRFSYPVCTARNARQALEMISVAIPALMITDMALPDMTGLELLRLVGHDPRTFSVPVMLVQPTTDMIVDKHCIEIGGAIACLTKPLKVEELYRAVQAAIEPTPRAHIRVPTQLPVALNHTALDISEGECVTQLSEQGMYVRMRKPLSRSKKVSVGIGLGGRTISAEAEVLYHHRFEEAPFKDDGMALKFVTMAPDDRAFIQAYVRDAMTRGLALEGREIDFT